MNDNVKDSTKHSANSDGEADKPEQKQDGQGTDESSDRAQPELTEQNLLTERRSEADTPEERDRLEGDLEDMEGDIQNANRK